MEAVERAVSGRVLYEATVDAAAQWTKAFHTSWDDLTWSERDEWEAKADELNESRRPL